MAEQLKDVIKKEYVKCAQDPAYFMKKYCMIQHPIRGKIPFELYNFQDKVVNEFQEHRMNVILKARQLGISTLTAGYSLWMMTFQQDKNILVIAQKHLGNCNQTRSSKKLGNESSCYARKSTELVETTMC